MRSFARVTINAGRPNYSNILGSLAAGGISNLYYPAEDRDGWSLTLENAGLGIGGSEYGVEFVSGICD
jgi:hypothetical protein